MNAEERILLKHFRALAPEARQSLLDYAGFLASRAQPPAVAVSVEPLAIERPAEETVVAAIKRLRKTYPMLEPGDLLNETASFMMKHMLHGHPAKEVIDELETLFQAHYARHQSPDA
jgi:hypothetical protein